MALIALPEVCNKRLVIVILTVYTLIFGFAITYWMAQRADFVKTSAKSVDFYNLEELRTELKQRLAVAKEKKTILIWYPPFGTTPEHNIAEEECGKCVVTYDRSKIDDEETAAVVIHFQEISPDSMPTAAQRKPSQLHIFWTMESPQTLKSSYHKTFEYEDRYSFNATMSHRRDSDFFTPYGRVWGSGAFYAEYSFPADESIMKRKTKLALALISHCGGSHGANLRMQLTRAILNTGFNLEAYGACFPGNGGFARGGDFVERVKGYKFFFSFENSHLCKDYVTEKLFAHALSIGTVPVVWGASKEDYAALAPPRSFIHVEDFATVKELVNHLDYLDKNDTAYMEYFKWHDLLAESEHQKSLRTDGFCEICRATHGINVEDIYNPKYSGSWKRPLFADGMSTRGPISLREWYYNQENPECLGKS